MRERALLLGLAFLSLVALKLLTIPSNDWPSFPDESYYVNNANAMAHFGVIGRGEGVYGLGAKHLAPVAPPLYSMALVPACWWNYNPLGLSYRIYCTNILLTTLALFPAYAAARYYKVRYPLLAAAFVCWSVPLTRYVFVGMSENLFAPLLVAWFAAYIYFYSRPNLWRGLLLALTLAALVLCRKAGILMLPAMAVSFLVHLDARGRPRLNFSKAALARLLMLLPALAGHYWTLTYLPSGRQTVGSYAGKVLSGFFAGEGSLGALLLWAVRPFYAQFSYPVLWTGGLLVFCAWAMWRNGSTAGAGQASGRAPAEKSTRLLAPGWAAVLAAGALLAGGAVHCLASSLPALSGGDIHPKYYLYDRYAEPVLALAWFFVVAIVLDPRTRTTARTYWMEACAACILSAVLAAGLGLYILTMDAPACYPLTELAQLDGVSTGFCVALLLAGGMLAPVLIAVPKLWWLPLAVLLLASHKEALESRTDYARHIRGNTLAGPLTDLRGEAHGMLAGEGSALGPILTMLPWRQTDAKGFVNVFFEQTVPLTDPAALYRSAPRAIYYAPQLRRFYFAGAIKRMAVRGQVDLLAAFGEYIHHSDRWRKSPPGFPFAPRYKNIGLPAPIPLPHVDHACWRAELPPGAMLYQDVQLPEATRVGGLIRAGAWFWAPGKNPAAGLQVRACAVHTKHIGPTYDGTSAPVHGLTARPTYVEAVHEVADPRYFARFVLENMGAEPAAFWIAKPSLYYCHPLAGVNSPSP